MIETVVVIPTVAIPTAEVMIGEIVPEMIVALVVPEVVVMKIVERTAENTMTETATTATTAVRHCPRHNSGCHKQGGNECKQFLNRHRVNVADLCGRALSPLGSINSTGFAVKLSR